MEYKISFSALDKFAKKVNSKKCKISLEQMREQASELKSKSIITIKKK